VSEKDCPAHAEQPRFYVFARVLPTPPQAGTQLAETLAIMLKRYAQVAAALLGLGCGGIAAGPDTLTTTPAQPLVAMTWSFVPIAGMTCANGSATGIGVNRATRSSGKVLIFLEGGGGCWDATTCQDSLHIQNANLDGFGATTLHQIMVAGATQYYPAIPPNYGAAGLWDRTSWENPFRDYDYVYIPYCTADFHAGNRPHSPADGLSHVGYVNMTHALAYLSASFTPASTTQVVLSGGSAGALGALWNFPQTQAAFGQIPVTLFAESGPPLPAPYLAAELEEAWRVAWGLDETKPAAAPSTHLFPYLQWMAHTYPERRLGFVEMTGDLTVALFFSVALTGADSLSDGLYHARALSGEASPNVSFFFIPSLVHDYLHQAPAAWPSPAPPYGNDGLALNDWIDLQMQ
jgi:hypothetical protein